MSDNPAQVIRGLAECPSSEKNQYVAAVLMDLSKYLKFIWISLHFVNFKSINKNI
jgi:hypothetical protein